MSRFDEIMAQITPVSAQALAAAEARQLELTKPPGALAELEVVGNRLAAIADQCPPPVPSPATLVVFAGDHGVQDQAVSPWPREVTVQMAANIATGGAASSVLARAFGVDVEVVDVGMATSLPASSGVVDARVRAGSADLSLGPALSREETLAAIEAGIGAAERAIDGGARLLVPGEVGIGNTTPAAALIAAFTGVPGDRTTGPGAGADEAMLSRKAQIVADAVTRLPQEADPLTILGAVGGLEHAATVGLILAAAAHRIPVVLDGAISCACALSAVALHPDVRGYLIAGHRGAEPGIAVAHAALGLVGLVDLGLRLGEGTGGLCAVPLVQASAKILREMATFAEAAVSGQEA